jgi:hypothetical protein
MAREAAPAPAADPQCPPMRRIKRGSAEDASSADEFYTTGC